ncbi:MAG: type II toxin-antitoxin system VapC family toxin [Gemmatimonadaceae bacterium]
MIVYAESSAILSWLLGEWHGEAVRETLAGAELVLASELALLECHRVLLRATHTGHLGEGIATDLRATLSRAGQHWVTLAIDNDVLDRARRPFPAEPIRTLDAIHLASALVSRSAVPGVALLTLDDRIRSNGVQLGFEVVPA